MRNVSLCLSLLCGACLLSPNATAQHSPSGSTTTVLTRPLADAMTKKARELFAEGVQAVAQGKLADARAAFIGAEALSPNYSNLCNLGDVELRLGSFVDAANHLRVCSDGLQADAKATAAERDTAKKILEKAKGNVVELAITSSVDGAEIEVHGVAAGRAPLRQSMFVLPGKVDVTASLDGYDAAKVDLDGKAGTVLPVALVLKKKEALPIPTATASATVLAPTRSVVPAYVMGGVGAAAAIVGAVLLGVGAERKGEADRLREQLIVTENGRACVPGNTNATCKRFAGVVGTAQDSTNIGAAALIAGGALAGASLLYVLLAKPGKPAPVQGGLAVTPLGGSVSLQGNW